MRSLCVIPGDGIGPEVTEAAVTVLQAVLPDLHIEHAEAGWGTFQRSGEAVPQATLEAMQRCGAGLFGAVQSPTMKVEGYRSAIITLRQRLKLSVNVRPVRSRPLVSPKPGVDLLILRENSECLYSGREHLSADGVAVAERVITREACLALAERAVRVAKERGAWRITLVHKANVLPLTCGLFRDTCRAVLKDAGFEPIVDERLVDVAALQLTEAPERFDLILITNLFGDILSDLAAHWAGGLGLAPSLNWGNGCALAEPVHGSAPDIVGTGRANPLAAILSAALLLRHHWGLNSEAELIENAVERFLAKERQVDFAGQTTRRITLGVLAALG